VQAIGITQPGGPEVLELVSAPEPAIGSSEVLVAVELAGVNFADVNTRRATYAGRGVAFQRGLGLEVYGRVAAAGPEVTGFPAGTRVAGFCSSPGYAELATCDQRLLWRIPEDLPDTAAASLLMAGQTAYHALHSAARLGQGERVLVTAAAGGVGTAAVQVARCLGAGLVVGAAGSAERADRALSHGADAALDYSGGGLEDSLERAVGTRVVDVVLDAVGGAVRAEALDCLAPFGRLIQYGNSAGGKEDLPDARSLRDRLISVGGLRLAQLRSEFPEALRASGDLVLDWAREGLLHMPVAGVLPLSEAAEAHRRLESREVIGKLLLKVP
jgi:NADPH:quinone reductase